MIEILVETMHEYVDWKPSPQDVSDELQCCRDNVCWDAVDLAEADSELSCSQAMRRLAMNSICEQGATVETLSNAMTFDYWLYYWALDAVYDKAMQKFIEDGE